MGGSQGGGPQLHTLIVLTLLMTCGHLNSELCGSVFSVLSHGLDASY